MNENKIVLQNISPQIWFKHLIYLKHYWRANILRYDGLLITRFQWIKKKKFTLRVKQFYKKTDSKTALVSINFAHPTGKFAGKRTGLVFLMENIRFFLTLSIFYLFPLSPIHLLPTFELLDIRAYVLQFVGVRTFSHSTWRLSTFCCTTILELLLVSIPSVWRS